MNEQISKNNNSPVLGSNENKIIILKARKTELLLRKNMTKDVVEIRHIENLLKDVDKLIEKHNLADTIRRRMKKNDED